MQRGEDDYSVSMSNFVTRRDKTGEMITLLIIREKKREKKRDIAVGCKDNTYLIYVIPLLGSIDDIQFNEI